MHIHTNGPGASPADIVDLLDDTVVGAMWNTVSDDWTVDDIAVTPLDGATATFHAPPADPTKWTGHTGGDFNPAVASIAKFSTGLRGRAHRGRIFMPPPANGQTTDGVITDGTPATATTAWGTFSAALQVDPTTPATLVVASYDRRHAGAGANFAGVTSILVEAVLATQRRRQGRLRSA